MKITILGSGTCVPSLKRSSCSVLLTIGKSRLLFDCGAGTMRQLLAAGVAIDKISYIFLSHLHPDHSADLVPFLFASKYAPLYARRKPFTIVAARGFAEFYENLKSAYGEWIELRPGLMEIVQLDPAGRDHLDCGIFDLESIPVNHTNMSLAYRITAGDGSSFVYSGDTDYCEGLIQLARGADLLICESAFPDEMKVDGHLTPSAAGRMATEAGVRKLVLTHFYPECDAVDLTGQCRKTYQGPLVLAEDLIELEV